MALCRSSTHPSAARTLPVTRKRFRGRGGRPTHTEPGEARWLSASQAEAGAGAGVAAIAPAGDPGGGAQECPGRGMAASSKAAAGGGAPQPARMAASWTCGVCSQSELTVSPLGSCGVCDLEICRRCQGAASIALYMGSTERFRWTYQPGQPVRFRLLAGACLTSARREPLPGFSPYWCMECCREDLVGM